jgi:hypothetical protein
MADPARDYDPPRPPQDPFNPIPPERSDPLGPEPLMTDLERRDEEMLADRPSSFGAGNGLLIAAVVVILAAVAFYIFGPGADNTPTAQIPAPAATDNTTTSSTTPNPPADTATGGNTAAPADNAAPAAPKPVEPAPAPAQ